MGWSSGKSTVTSPTGPFTVARYNTNGSLDPTFGSGGVAVVPVSSAPGYGATAVAIQPSDGKILVAVTTDISVNKNSTNPYYSDFMIARLNTNGTLDTTFGGGKGYVTTSLTPPRDIGQNLAESIVVQAKRPDRARRGA